MEIDLLSSIEIFLINLMRSIYFFIFLRRDENLLSTRWHLFSISQKSSSKINLMEKGRATLVIV